METFHDHPRYSIWLTHHDSRYNNMNNAISAGDGIYNNNGLNGIHMNGINHNNITPEYMKNHSIDLLNDTIKYASQKLNTPPFMAHQTLVSGGLKHLDLNEIRTKITKVIKESEIKPIPLEIENISCQDTNFRCIYATLKDQDHILLKLHKKLTIALYENNESLLDTDKHESFLPHISLVYATTDLLPLSIRQEIAGNTSDLYKDISKHFNEMLIGYKFLGDAIHVVECETENGVYSAPSWKIVDTIYIPQD